MGGDHLWRNDLRVNSDLGESDQREPVIAINPTDCAIIVWADERNDNLDIYAQRVNALGSKLWGTDVRVNSDITTVHQWYPDLSVEEDGNTLIAWNDDRAGDSNIYGQLLDASGDRLWVNDLRIDSASDTSLQSSPNVGLDSANTFIIAWSDRRSGNQDVYAQRIDVNATRLWKIDSRINDDAGTVSQHYPSVTINSGGDIIAVWGDSRNDLSDVYMQSFDNNGNAKWQADLRINADTVGAQAFPVIVVDSIDNIWVAWLDDDRLWYQGSSTFVIYAQRFDAQGNRLADVDFRVNDIGTYAYGLDMAVDSQGNAIVVWSDKRTGDSNIYAQKIGMEGERIWGKDIRVNTDSGTASQGSPKIATEGENIIVVWDDDRNGDSDIYAQKLDDNGNHLWGGDLRVNSDLGTSRQSDPAIASQNGHINIAWEDGRNNYGYDVYAQKLESAGSKMWATDVCVNSADVEASQTAPKVNLDDTGVLLVAWHDFRGEETGLGVQRLSVSGTHLWTEDLIVNNVRYSEVAFDAVNAIVVVWQDVRNGSHLYGDNWDIYAQKINQVGNKIWLADLQVVYPDVFYFSSGTAQSRAVDTTDDIVTEATLTAQYVLQGGSVDFYLTNDGGAHWAEVQPGVTHVFTTTGSDLRWRVEMTSDPRGRDRSPIIDTLRIEYTTATADGDDYEPDDTCTQAQPIQVGGVAQMHNFHQYQDDDWVWFDAQAGNSYLVKTTNEGERAHALLEIYAECGEPPTELPVDFGTGASVSFEADVSRRYYVRTLHHDGSVYGAGTEYTLQVGGEGPPAQAPGAVIIVAGRLYASDSKQSLITATGNRAYEIFLDAGYVADNIQYLNTDTTQTGVDAVPSWGNVRDAVQAWARTRVGPEQPLWLYLIDHGNVDRFHNDVGEVVTPAELDLWLDNLEQHSKVDEVTVIMDACFSGSFIDTYREGGYGAETLSREDRHRVIISSTSSQWWAYGPPNDDWEPYLFFSAGFLHALGREGGYQNVWEAYQAGEQYVQAQGQWPGWGGSVGQQTPWLDDNGDRKMDTSDGTRAQQRGLGHAVAMGGIIPYIESLTVTEPADNGAATVAAEVVDDGTVETVWVRVFAPSFAAPQSADGSIPVLEVPEVELESDGDGIFRGTYSGFTEKGVYQVGIYARDTDGNYARPRWVWVGGQKVYLPLVTRGN
jgi:hypothetical protein